MANEVTVSFLFVQCIDSVGTVDAHVFSCSCIRFSASQSPRIWCATVREICFCEKCPADGALSFARRHLPDARSETSAVQDAEDQDQCCQLHDASAILSFRTWAYSDRVLSKSRMQAWHRKARRTNIQRILVRLWCDIFLSELPLATQRTARDRWNQKDTKNTSCAHVQQGMNFRTDTDVSSPACDGLQFPPFSKSELLSHKQTPHCQQFV